MTRKTDWQSLAWALLATLVILDVPAAHSGEARRQPAAAHRRGTVSIPLTPYFRGLKTVQLQIGGKHYTFLFDSGGGQTLLAPQVAAAMGCQPRGHDVGYRMTGEAVAFKHCGRLDATLGGYAVHLAPVGVFDLNSLLPKELPRLDGALALDSFAGQVLTIDWAQSSLTVHSRTDRERALRAHGLPLRVATGENGAALTALVPVRSASAEHWFLVDSGNIRATLISSALLDEGLFTLDEESMVRLQIGSGPGERIAVVADAINYDGVLGTDYLQTHVVTLDLGMRRYLPPLLPR